MNEESNKKRPAYRYEQGDWIRVEFDDLQIGDLIQLFYADEENERVGNYWRVSERPRVYEGDTMGIVCDPVDRPIELEQT